MFEKKMDNYCQPIYINNYYYIILMDSQLKKLKF